MKNLKVALATVVAAVAISIAASTAAEAMTLRSATRGLIAGGGAAYGCSEAAVGLGVGVAFPIGSALFCAGVGVFVTVDMVL